MSYPALAYFSYLTCEMESMIPFKSHLEANFKLSGVEGISGLADDYAASLGSNLMMWL